ncbi:hypothetical protein FQU75_20895 [Paenibacillus polymyxa]|nr:hypothetical protein FQU75_20895 [Paenibacillus polymyxa]
MEAWELVVLREPLRVWKVLTIAVAARFQDWINPFTGLESSGKGERCASPESFHPLRSSGVHHFTAVPVPLLFPRRRG